MTPRPLNMPFIASFQAMQSTVVLILLSVAMGAPTTPAKAAQRAPRPPVLNIVFFLADDLGQRDLGCYGSTFYDTPHLNQLAREGARFTQAYAACPVCSPTRASLLTGRYPQRTGITDYIGAQSPQQWKRNTRLLPAPYRDRLALEETTIAEVLRAAGYATFFAGKWHLGPEGFFPEDQGFDVNKGGLDRGGPYGGNKYFSPYGNPRLTDGPEGEHLPDRLAREASDFIRVQAGHGKPFLVYFPFYDVHTPLMAREDLRRKYELRRAALKETDRFADEGPRKVRLTQDHAVYGAMVEAMDLAVGRVLATLSSLGLAENTVVLFTSDNGGLSTSEGSPTSNAPLRAGKGWMYEGGIRVPLIVRWPGITRAGSVIDTPVISPDLFPTLRDAAGLPPGIVAQRDGISLLPVLRGRAASRASRRPIFWHYPHYGNQGGAPASAVRQGNWKLIEWLEEGRTELFDLGDDPGESLDLTSRNPRKTRELLSRLRQWRGEVGALMPSPNPRFDLSKPDGRR